MIQQWIDDMSNGTRQEGAQARRQAKSFSLHPVLNPWREAPCGDTKGRGYFSLVWSEVMHQSEGGVMKKTCEHVSDILLEAGKSKSTQESISSQYVMIGSLIHTHGSY